MLKSAVDQGFTDYCTSHGISDPQEITALMGKANIYMLQKEAGFKDIISGISGFFGKMDPSRRNALIGGLLGVGLGGLTGYGMGGGRGAMLGGLVGGLGGAGLGGYFGKDIAKYLGLSTPEQRARQQQVAAKKRDLTVKQKIQERLKEQEERGDVSLKSTLGGIFGVGKEELSKGYGEHKERMSKLTPFERPRTFAELGSRFGKQFGYLLEIPGAYYSAALRDKLGAPPKRPSYPFNYSSSPTGGERVRKNIESARNLSR